MPKGSSKIRTKTLSLETTLISLEMPLEEGWNNLRSFKIEVVLLTFKMM